MGERDIREVLDRHWAASDTEHEIYRDDALLEYPQSGDQGPRKHPNLAYRATELETLYGVEPSA